MVSQEYRETHSLGYQTGLAGRLFNQLLTRRFSDAGIDMTAEQWGVIVVLLNYGPVTQVQLAELLYLEKSTISRSVSGLERRGWVVSKRDPDDGRHRLIELTSNAIGVAERCTEIAQGVLRDAQAGLDADSVGACLKIFSGVIMNLRKLNEL